MDYRKVFLSSTSDLVACREAAKKELDSLKYDVEWMERFPSSPDDPATYCRERVRESHLFICILGHSYGSLVKGDHRSFTEMEYDEAGLAKIPRLVFLLNDDAHLDGCLPVLRGRGGARVIDERQHAFRERVKGDLLVTPFSKPLELCLQIAHAIRELPVEKVAPRAGTHLGPHVHQTCDRSEEMGKLDHFFRENYNADPGCPQLFLFAGEHGDALDSLVERFIFGTVRPFLWGCGKGLATAEPHKPEWVHRGDLPELQTWLRGRLWNKLDATYSGLDMSVSALAGRPSLATAGAVPILHTIHAEQLNKHTVPLIKWYAEYWAELKGRASNPLFLIFLAVILDGDGGARLPEAPVKRPSGVRVRRELAAFARSESSPVPCLLLDRLGTPGPCDVFNWFSLHAARYSDEECRRKSEEVIDACGGRVSMSKIEAELKRFVKEPAGRV